jgi:hypothetical protein
MLSRRLPARRVVMLLAIYFPINFFRRLEQFVPAFPSLAGIGESSQD